MIKLKKILKESYSRKLLLEKIELIFNNIKNNIDCSKYLFEFKLPSSIYKKILSDKNTDVNIRNGYGETPLHAACIRNIDTILIVKLLLSHPDIDVNDRDINNCTPLSLACNFNNILIIELLLAHPKIEVNARNHSNNTALHYACSACDELIVKLFLQHPDIDINIRNEFGRTPINLTSNKLIIKMLIEFNERNNK